MKTLLIFNIVFLSGLLLGCTSQGQSPVSKYQDLNAEAFKKMADENPDVVVLDVRTASEVAAGKIPEALVIDISTPDFKEKISQLDKDKTYLVYCRSGRRSVSACNIMKEAGFDSLYNLKGGILSWQREFPVVKE